MINVSVYFWKEWREQRGPLAVLAVVLLCAVAIVTAILPRETLFHPVSCAGVVGLTVLAMLMSVGSDLLARERQHGAIGFLERLSRKPRNRVLGKAVRLSRPVACNGRFRVAARGRCGSLAHR